LIDTSGSSATCRHTAADSTITDLPVARGEPRDIVAGDKRLQRSYRSHCGGRVYRILTAGANSTGASSAATKSSPAPSSRVRAYANVDPGAPISDDHPRLVGGCGIRPIDGCVGQLFARMLKERESSMLVPLITNPVEFGVSALSSDARALKITDVK